MSQSYEISTDVNTLFNKLTIEYYPVLDSSLLLSILSDYEGNVTSEQERVIRLTLNSIAATTESYQDRTDGEEDEDSQIDALLREWLEEERKLETEIVVVEPSIVESIESAAFPPLALVAPSELVAATIAEDPVAFLSAVFPKVSTATLASRLREEGSSLETLLEILLNEDYIAATTLNRAHYEEVGDVGGKRNAEGTTRLQRKKEKSVLKASKVLSLTDVLHRPTPRSASPSGWGSVISKPDSNRWVTLDSTANYLATLLHISPGRVTSYYHRYDSSLPLAINALLDALQLERPFISLLHSDEIYSTLASILSSSPPTVLYRLLSATDGDVSDALDLQVKLIEMEKEQGNLLSNGLIGFGAGGDSRRVVVVHEESTLEPIRFTPLVVPKMVNEGGGWRKIIPSSSAFPLPSSSRLPPLDSSTDRSTSKECEVMALEYLVKRNEAYRAAARHFQVGTATAKGSAAYFAEEGREMDRRKRVWESRGSFAVVRERRIHDSSTIDLHGLSLHHALSVVKASCNSWWSGSSAAQAPLRIVTGIGKHSVNQNPILAPAVVKLLDREGWRWKYDGMGGGGGRGAILVTGVSSGR